MDKQNVVYNTMEYYEASKRKEIVTWCTTWMSLEDIMLHGISQSKKGQTWYDPTYVRYLK